MSDALPSPFGLHWLLYGVVFTHRSGWHSGLGTGPPPVWSLQPESSRGPCLSHAFRPHTHVCTHAHTRPTWSHCSRGFSCHFLAHDSHLPPCALDPGTPLLPSRFSLLIHRHPDPWTKFTVSPAETASSHLLCPAPCLALSWTVLHPVPTSGPICPPPGPLWILCIHPADAFGESFSLQSMARLTFLNTD